MIRWDLCSRSFLVPPAENLWLEAAKNFLLSAAILLLKLPDDVFEGLELRISVSFTSDCFESLQLKSVSFTSDCFKGLQIRIFVSFTSAFFSVKGT